MRQARKVLIGLTAILVVTAMALPAGSAIGSAGGSDSPVAAAAKKKCKKGKKKKKKCKKRGGGGSSGPYLQGRYSGNYAEIPADLLFNVAGGRLYTGPFDSFHARATCHNSSGVGSPTYTEVVRIEPVQAAIAANGDFAGSGTWPTGSGRFIPWKISGHIQGRSITNGVFEVGPYPDFAGDPCSGTNHFTAEWFAPYTL